MSTSLIISLADTTAHRDRDDLNLGIGVLLLGYLNAESVDVYRLCDDEGVKRVARRIGLIRGGARIGADDLNALALLPALTEIPAWDECVAKRVPVRFSALPARVRTVFPIENEREVIGLLEVATTADLPARDAELVTGILRILRNQLELLDYGERDTLTGLLNRKTFESSFDKLRSRVSASASADVEPSWLGVVDIDKFKSVNDNFGHLFGDEVLLLVAQLMRQSFRGADHLFRFGGEEFVIVLDRASEVGADVAFNRLRAAVENFRFPQIGRVTITLGYTQIKPLDAPGSCVERADAALYYGKHHGRNRVCRYETLIAQGELQSKNKSDDIELF